MDAAKMLTPSEIIRLREELGSSSLQRGMQFLSNLDAPSAPRMVREAKNQFRQVLDEAESHISLVNRGGETYAVVGIAHLVRLASQITANPLMAEVLDEVRGAPAMGQDVRAVLRGGKRSHARMPESAGQPAAARRAAAG